MLIKHSILSNVGLSLSSVLPHQLGFPLSLDDVDDLTDYMAADVGGGLCGLPDQYKTAVGLSLNLSLVAFGILTVGYIIFGVWAFALERDIDGDIKKMRFGNSLFALLEPPKVGQLANEKDMDDNMKLQAFLNSANLDNQGGSTGGSGGVDFSRFNPGNPIEEGEGENREQRRLKRRLE